jgi:excisionase family DNA binding protein
MIQSDEILVPEEICDYLRITRAKFYYLSSRGRLSFLFKVGNAWRARRSDLEEWIQANTSVMLSISERRGSVTKEQQVAERITTDQVQALLSDQGYEVHAVSEGLLNVRDVESGIVMHAVLQENVLFCTVSCLVVPEDVITAELMRKMLRADNGISTSGFQLYARDDGKVAVTLNNFCKLQAMEADDEDDICACLEFLVADVVAAHGLLTELVS